VAVSKRLRFEILRRDNHTCRYCGRKPPEVQLTIDHVQPTALGGRDVAENLVACCRECNSGKTSTMPDAPLVAQVTEDEMRWSAAVHAGVAKLLADHQAEADYRRQFLDAWNGWEVDAEKVPLDPNWELSIENFRTRRLPVEVLIASTGKAMAAPKVATENIFRYLCGIAWNKIGELEQVAREHFNASPSSPSAMALDARLAATVTEAAVHVWHSMWCAAHGADPTPSDLAEVRGYVEELFPEQSADTVIRAAERAAESGTTAVPDYLVEDEYPEPEFAERVADWWFRGWAASTLGATPRPTRDLWIGACTYILAAKMAGYDEDTICEASFRAGQQHSNDLRLALISVDEVLVRTEGDQEFLHDVRRYFLTDEEVAAYIAHAERHGLSGGWGI
jgi:HNH endonuclease